MFGVRNIPESGVIENDEQARAVESFLKEATQKLNTMCKNNHCTNDRRNGSSYCQQCSNDNKAWLKNNLKKIK